MSSVVIAGDTSGTVTLQAPAVAGSTVLSLPSTSGTILTTAGGTAATSTNLAGGGSNTVVYQSTSGTTAYLTNGTTGQFLAANTSGAPTWGTPSAGALTLLSTVTASSSATVDVETTFSSTYDAYMLVVSGARPATDSVSLYARMKIGGSYITTSTYISTGGYTSLSGNQETTLAAQITLVSGVWGNDAASSCDVVMYIFNPSSTAFKKQIRYEATSLRIDTGATQIQTRSGVGSNDGTAALTGIRFFASSGNIAEGKFRLYGIANS